MLPCVAGCLHRAVGTRVSLGGDSVEVDVFLLCSSAEDCTMKPGCSHGSPCPPPPQSRVREAVAVRRAEVVQLWTESDTHLVVSEAGLSLGQGCGRSE